MWEQKLCQCENWGTVGDIEVVDGYVPLVPNDGAAPVKMCPFQQLTEADVH